MADAIQNKFEASFYPVGEELTGGVSTNHTSVFVYAALLLVLLTIVTGALGILVGRMWQRRVEKWHELPAVEKDGYLEPTSSFCFSEAFGETVVDGIINMVGGIEMCDG